MACNYHFHELAKILIDAGADTEVLDSFGFKFIF
jgi:hypothetical protein